MTFAEFSTLSPFIVLAATTVAALLVSAFYRRHRPVAMLTLAGLIVSLLALLLASTSASRQVTALLIVDDYALFYIGLLLLASIVVLILSYGYLAAREGDHEEFYIMLLLATLGGATLVASSHYASFFLGLEILSVSLYTLISYPRQQDRSIEAGLKYLILAGASASFLLFGMALVYADLGTMAFARQAQAIARHAAPDWLLQVGLAMIVVGIGFKLAVVPFHMWTPDVYEGAPAPVTAFVATISKGAMFALLLRYLTQTSIAGNASLRLILTVIAIASILIGNLLALQQTNVKRLLAYSSIAHLGYLLVALLAGGSMAASAVTFYLVAYFVTTLGAFGVVAVLSTGERDADAVADYLGLFWRRPWMATILAVMLFSLAGIPLTAGFMGKLYIVLAGVGSTLWLPVIILVVGSTIGLYYYLRLIVAMLGRPTESAEAAPPLPGAGYPLLAVLTLVLVWLGIYPTPLVAIIERIVASLSS